MATRLLKDKVQTLKDKAHTQGVQAEVDKLLKDNPESVIGLIEGGPRMMLSELFPGDNNKIVREGIISRGYIQQGRNTVRVATKKVGDDHEIVALAALSTFDPGLTSIYIDTIQDFIATTNSKDKTQEIAQLWQIYRQEGIINNSINKIAALLSGGGTFKVRNAKLGRKPDATNRLLVILETWQDKVNTSAPEAVVTGARGLQSVTHQGVRRALVEGDWVARHVWQSFDVLGFGSFKLPMNVQSISSAQLIPVDGLPPGAEAFYWKPASDLIQKIQKPTDKNAANIIKQFIPKDMLSELKKTGKYFLDPALMLHVRHRGVDTDVWGESFITPALQAIAYKRAIDQLDFSSMQNLINRLTIVMVGSSDPTSPYSKADVATSRQALMASFFEDPGPNMTIIWAGDDVKVENIGAKDVLDLDGRHDIGTNKIKMSLGVPEALLSGSTTDGKAAGWAASLGSAAQLEELQNAFAKVWTQLGEKIAEENGFTDVDIIFEFDKSLLVDRLEELSATRADYAMGLITISDFLLARDKDPSAVFIQKCFEKGLDPATTKYEEAFAPPVGLAGQAVPPAADGPGGGRQPNSEQGLPASPERPVKPTTKENK